MKNKKTIYLLIFLLFIQLAYAGVSHPSQISLAPGEKAEFNFAVDNAIFNVPIECTISLETKQTSLEISFKKTKVRLEPGTREFIIGEVKVPKNINSGFYKETFCVSCDKLSNTPGATTRPRYCGIPIRVNVGEEYRTNNKENPFNISTSVLTLMNILLLIIVILLYTKRRRSK